MWHVDHAWRKALNEQISNMQHRLEVYHQLCVLLNATEERVFIARMQQLMSFLHEKHEEFHKLWSAVVLHI